MPLMNKQDKKGRYFKFGIGGKKYYYITNNKISRNIAKNKALKQGRAIATSKYGK